MVEAEPLQSGIPGAGFQLVFDGGEKCEVTKKPRQTIVRFPCAVDTVMDVINLSPMRAYEGEKKSICTYFVEFPPSQFGCPLRIDSIAGHTEILSTMTLLAGMLL